MSDSEWFYPASQFIFMAIDTQEDSKIYLHYPSNLTVQSKFIKVHARDYNRIKELSKWRFQTEYPVFKILRAKAEQEKRQATTFEIFLQKPQYLLCELSSITLLQALYIIKSCLPALQRLVQKFGYFELNGRMIGISRSNECKLWISEKLQKFQIEKQASGEQAMTYSLLKLVQNLTRKNQKSKQFFDVASYQCGTFMKAQKFLSLYAYEQDFVIPPQFFPKNRKGSAQISPIFSKVNEYNCKSCTRSFILQNNRQRQLSPHYLPKSEKKKFFIKQQQKPSFINFNKNIPLKISSKHSLKTTCEIKQSKQTLMRSNQSIFKSNCFERKSLPDQSKSPFKQFSYTQKPWLNSYIQNSQRPIFKEIESQLRNRKKLTIMSTIDVKIVSDQNIKQQLFRSQKKTRGDYFEIKDFCKEKLQNNQWKKTISQLFSSQNNLKQSLSYGEEEKAYLKQIQLHKLGQFGRFINTSLLEIQQSQEDHMNQSKKNYN